MKLTDKEVCIVAADGLVIDRVGESLFGGTVVTERLRDILHRANEAMTTFQKHAGRGSEFDKQLDVIDIAQLEDAMSDLFEPIVARFSVLADKIDAKGETK